MTCPTQIWLYRALAASVLLVLLWAVFSHLGHVRALIQGEASAQPALWAEVCTPQGIQRVALADGL